MQPNVVNRTNSIEAPDGTWLPWCGHRECAGARSVKVHRWHNPKAPRLALPSQCLLGSLSRLRLLDSPRILSCQPHEWFGRRCRRLPCSWFDVSLGCDCGWAKARAGPPNLSRSSPNQHREEPSNLGSAAGEFILIQMISSPSWPGSCGSRSIFM